MASQEDLIRLIDELHIVRENGDKNQLITALRNLINAYSKSKTVFESIPYAEELNKLLTGDENMLAAARNHDYLGRIYTFLPNFVKSEYHSSKALELYTRLDDSEGKFYAYHNLGMIYRHLGKYDRSLEYLFNAKKYMEQHLKENDDQVTPFFLKRTPSLLEQIGIIYASLNQVDKSREYLKLSLQKAREINGPESISRELINLGVSYSNEDPDIALEYYQEALPLVKEQGGINVLAVVKNNIGGVYEDKGEYEKALVNYQEALQLLEKAKIYKNHCVILKHIGTVNFKMKKYDEALNFVIKSLKEAEKNHQNLEVEENYQLLGNIYKTQGKFQESLENFEKYSQLKDTRLNSEVIEKISNLQKKYDATISKLVKTERKSSLISESLKNQINMNFIGNSHAIKEVHKLALMAAEHCDTNVLITGESGTGKEIIAHIIHFASRRNDNIFIPVNCSSIPENLSESEFFGHKKGAFTGASSDKVGYLEDASSGTLFLDEIGDMPLPLQAKLLRVLETKIVKPIGTNKSIKVNFRLIAATNKDISKLIGENVFRVDLFYRINTIQIHIPPLRERRADIEPLTHFFVSNFAEILKKTVPRITKELIERLREYHFPGNVRELRNMVERAMIMIKTDTLGIESFNLTQTPAICNDQLCYSESTIEEMEKQMIINTLDQTGNNLTHTAKKLGISYSTLNRKIKTYQLR